MKPLDGVSLLLLSSLALSAPAQQTPQTLTPEEQARKDELLRRNPELRRQIEENENRGLQVRNAEASRIELDSLTGQPVPGSAEAAAAKTEEPKFAGNADTAAEAYRRKDYQTALENYRALARDGDPQATLMVGIMQQEGQGTKKDRAAAYAWYGRAADLGDDTATQIVRGMNDNDELSRREQEAAAKAYEELSKEFDDEETAKNAGKRFEDVQSQTQVNVPEYSRGAPKNIGFGESRSTGRPRTYERPPARTGESEDFRAGTYDEPTDD